MKKFVPERFDIKITPKVEGCTTYSIHDDELPMGSDGEFNPDILHDWIISELEIVFSIDNLEEFKKWFIEARKKYI